MTPQLLFFDIDGTLISWETKKVPKSTIQAISEARANGHLAFVNTARTWASVQDIVKNIPFDGFVCGCSTYVTLHGHVISHTGFSADQSARIIERMQAHRVEAFLEDDKDIYCKRPPLRVKAMDDYRLYYNSMGLCLQKFIGEEPLTFDKFLYMTDDEAASAALLHDIEDMVEIFHIGPGVYECPPKGCNKSLGMKILSDHLGIPLRDTWAFGDSVNDAEMLRDSGHGIAMGKHAPALEACADCITDTVENHGIRNALMRGGLI